MVTVDEYLAAQPAPARKVLKAVRAALKKALPDAEESISYGIPTYKLDGRAVVYCAAWKQHWSMYPASTALQKTLGDALDDYEVQKGTIRFPYDARVPATLIARIAKLRAREVAPTPSPGGRAVRRRRRVKRAGVSAP